MKQELSYEEFPVAQDAPAGMKTLEEDPRGFYVTYVDDVRYIEREGIPLTLQIFVPLSRAGGEGQRHPLVVYVQGSGWQKQNVRFNIPQVSRFAKLGYVVALVEYRPSDTAVFPAQIQDAKTAIRFLRKNAAEYHIDPENVVLWGDSSGGHTAVMAGVTQGEAEFDTDAYPEYSSDVRAIVEFYGPTDLSRMSELPSICDHSSPESIECTLLGIDSMKKHPEITRRSNPMEHISAEKPVPPMLILHGDKDRIVPFRQSVLLYEHLKCCGKEVEFYKMRGADHGTAGFWSDEVYSLMDAFIKRHLRG